MKPIANKLYEQQQPIVLDHTTRMRWAKQSTSGDVVPMLLESQQLTFGMVLHEW